MFLHNIFCGLMIKFSTGIESLEIYFLFYAPPHVYSSNASVFLWKYFIFIDWSCVLEIGQTEVYGERESGLLEYIFALKMVAARHLSITV